MLKGVQNINGTKCDKVQDAGATRCDSVHQISESISKNISCLCSIFCIKLPRKMCKMLHKLVGKMCRACQYLLRKMWNDYEIWYKECRICIVYA